MRKESSSDAVLEADLGGFCGGDGGKVDVGGQKEVPVDQESGAGDLIGGAGGCGHGRSLAGENSGFHPLGLAHSLAETPRFSETAHFWGQNCGFPGIQWLSL